MNLKEYVQHVYMLEKSCYEQNLLMTKIQRELKSTVEPKLDLVYTEKALKKKREHDVVIGIVSIFKGIGHLIIQTAIVGGCIFIIGLIIWFLLLLAGLASSFLKYFFFRGFFSMIASAADKVATKSGSMKFFLVFAVIGIIAGLFCGVAALMEDVDLPLSKEEMSRINNENEQKNVCIAELYRVRTSNLQSQLTIAKEHYNRTHVTLTQFYNAGIIFPKYRSLVPVSMFYEYFASGRCSSLEGHEGAYNIYEQELRMNTIINKLDDIISRLDAIQENQYMLANAIRESNRTAQRIYDMVMDCSSKLQSIAADSDATKYYSQIAALNTTYLAWLKRNP